MTGKLSINFGNEEVVDGGDINGTKSVEYTYKTAGEYNLSAQVTETDGTQTRETIRTKVEAAARSSGTGGDDINASEVRWFADCNISGWPIEERVLDVSISSSEICVDYSGRGSKGTFDIGIPVDATLWVFAEFNGVWYGATWDHLRPGAFCKAENAHSLGSEQIMRPTHGRLVGAPQWRPDRLHGQRRLRASRVPPGHNLADEHQADHLAVKNRRTA